MDNENAVGKSKDQKKNGNDIKSLLALKSIFSFNGKKRSGDSDAARTPPYQSLPFLSPLANSVVSRCCKILQVEIEELQHQFDSDFPDDVKQPLLYARNFLEFCSFQALQVATIRPDYLSDQDFRRLMFDMMLAWEGPCVGNQETAASDKREVEDEDSWSLFYSDSTNMAVQVDDKKTVGADSFSRIAPACAIVADIITVHNLFDVLASSSGHRLHFLIYDKYLRSLEKGWIKYALPALLVVLAVIMCWRRNVRKGKPLEPLKIIAPPPKNAVELLLVLQEAISQLEALIQSGNIILLKIRALIFAVLPQATDRTALFLVIVALAFAFVPLKYLILFAFLESFTSNMPLRKISSERDLRRVREWWIRIPAAPVQLVKPDDKKTR